MTRAERELELLEARRTELLAKVVAERAVPASLARKALAVRLHRELCVAKDCAWEQDHAGDDPELADWSEAVHALWLSTVNAAVSLQESLGWTVAEPK